MFQNDYLMRMILQLVEALRRSWMQGEHSPEHDIQSIEAALGECLELDSDLALNLEPDSLVAVLDLGSFNHELGGYVTRSLYYEAELLDSIGKNQCASLRRAQADAIALKYSIEISEEYCSPEELDAWFDEQEALSDPEAFLSRD